MTKKPSPLGAAAASVALLLMLFLVALSVPMRRGATLWQAIAVLPQPVLWIVPILVAAPVLLTLAFGIRPHWHSVLDKDRDVVPAGSLGPLADALRRASGSRFSRSQVVGRLVRLSTNLAASTDGGTEQEAWERAQRRLDIVAPHVAAFLRHEDTLHLSGSEFRDLVDETVGHLERQQEEA